MAYSLVDGDLRVSGTFSAGTLIVPNNTVVNASIQASAGIDASKLEHQHQPTIWLSDYATNAAVTRRVVHVVRGATAVIWDFKVGAAIAATVDATATIDLKKNGTSILSSSISLTATTAAFALKGGSFSSTALVQNDVLEIDVSAVSAGAGALAKGLFATLEIREAAQ